MTCPHHWLIDDPIGTTSHAVCKLCGEESEFENHTPYVYGTTIANISADFWAPYIQKNYMPPARLRHTVEE